MTASGLPLIMQIEYRQVGGWRVAPPLKTMHQINRSEHSTKLYVQRGEKSKAAFRHRTVETTRWVVLRDNLATNPNPLATRL